MFERFPGLFSTQIIGRSRQGRPIELVTLGHGSYSALLVAGVHANEPVGNLAADVLMHELADNARLRQQLDTTWNFINPIDPDGLLLNEAWFAAPPTPERYFGSFFRPALSRQPDYTFPLRVGSYEFSDQSPENQAFQAAIDLTRPNLLLPMHNCEFGGAFFIASHSRPEFENRLRSLAALMNVRLSTIGEPLSGLAPISNGVFETPRPHRMIQAALQNEGSNPQSVWPAGGSSMEYAERYGSFSLTVETPLWQTFAQETARWTLAQVLEEQVSVLQSTLSLLEEWATPILSNQQDSELVFALAEQLSTQRNQATRLPQLGAMSGAEVLDPGHTTSLRVQLGLFALRGPALLLRLMDALPEPHRSRASTNTRELIRSELARIEGIAPLEPTDLTSMIALQALACLEGAMSAQH